MPAFKFEKNMSGGEIWNDVVGGPPDQLALEFLALFEPNAPLEQSAVDRFMLLKSIDLVRIWHIIVDCRDVDWVERHPEGYFLTLKGQTPDPAIMRLRPDLKT